MHMGLSIHIIHQFYNSTEIKNKLSTKSSSSLILREHPNFLYQPVGKHLEVINS